MKPLTKTECFVVEITWGNIPLDIQWIRSSKLFLENLNKYNNGEFKELYK